MTSSRASRSMTLLAVVAVVALSVNLRPAAVSVGPVLDDIRTSLGMNGATAGILTTLPVLAFAVFGASAPRFAKLLGVHRLTLVASVAIAVGLWFRTQVHSSAAFLLWSLVGLAGMATANVILPMLIKQHFASRTGLMTAVYTTALAVGMTAASVLTVPISQGFGTWRDGLTAWAITGAVAILPWFGMLTHDSAPEETDHSIRMIDVARTRLGRRMVLFFGLQSLQAYSIFGWFAAVYSAAGFSDKTAGLLLGVITGMSIPLSLAIPMLAARMHNQAVLMYLLMGCYPVGYLGLIFAPHAGAWLWAVVVGVGAATFPLILTLIGLRSRTAAGTAALSGLTQGAGYLIAAIGPFGVGLLHELTDGWTVPLLVLLAISIPQLIVGLLVSRPAYIEDELRARADSGLAPAQS